MFCMWFKHGNEKLFDFMHRFYHAYCLVDTNSYLSLIQAFKINILNKKNDIYFSVGVLYSQIWEVYQGLGLIGLLGLNRGGSCRYSGSITFVDI